MRRVCRALALQLHAAATSAGTSCSNSAEAAGAASVVRRFTAPSRTALWADTASASPPHTGLAPASKASGSVIEEAATARLQKIKHQLEHTGELPPEPSTSPIWTAIRYVWNTALLGVLGAGSVAAYYTYAYDTKEVAKQITDGRRRSSVDDTLVQTWYSVLERYLEVRRDFEARVKDFTDPTYHRLLPDLPSELRGRVKTLVLDLDDLLVHKEWTRQKGWTIYKRPGVQDFLLEVAQYYEVVIFTDEPNTYADPIINRLDAHKVIPYRLYRPETQYHNGKHVRDLSKLNRDITQVLMISADPDSWTFQPENTLKLQRWEGDSDDTMLLDLIPFLQMVATRGVKDVRSVVSSYDGETNVAAAFRARLHAAQQHQQQHSPKRGMSFLGK